ncbi:uncharacterized protein LOC103696784 [Phoenix dactylifera]|uniref:Uncharacterized protein LOC103696784 n=1 Tax=Phoenix dactylifera TaxID=42345 RepID=A0A8B8ZVB2_PHODC|nr:uncharacterized protein LOC120106321 [Phoenix dactylifera]XP_038975453.1 uncharacterized protein LOC103696784 [Phoenix dactylifera]
MASQTPIFVLDENLPFHRGKGVDGIKADVPKPAKPARHERKALRDLSKAGKPLPTGATKGSTLKDKATVHDHENPKNASKNSFLTDEEIKKCHEWAKQGIEHAHFTGTEQRKLQKEKDKERVRKKVDKVMSALREWTDMAYNFGLPRVDAADVTESIGKLELEPEVLPPRARSHLNSGNDKLEDLLLEPELDWYPFLDQTLELKLKDDIYSR